METKYIVTLIVGLLACPWLPTLGRWLFQKTFKRPLQTTKLIELCKATNAEVEKIKFDQMRTNIMILISAYPNSAEIPELAKRYISKGGDSYIIPLIAEWFDKKSLNKPDWLLDAIALHNKGGH